MKQLILVLKKCNCLLVPLILASILCALAALCKTAYAMQIADFLDTVTAYHTIPPKRIAAILGFLLVFLALMMLSEWLFGKLILKGKRILNEENANVLLHMKLTEKMASGEILDRINRDSSDFQKAVSGLLRGSLVTGITSLVMVSILSNVCWQLAITAFALPIFYNLCVARFSQGNQSIQLEERRQMSHLGDFLEDRMVNQVEVRLWHMESVTSVQHGALLSQWDRVKKKLSRFWAIVAACDALLYLGYRLVLVLVGIMFVNKGEMTFGDIFTFLTLSNTFMSFIWDFQIESYRNAIAAAQKLLEFWQVPRERATGHVATWKNDEIPISVRNISFSYQKNEVILKDVSFAVYHGEMFGITGESGCGKSTLLNLLCGFIDPSCGEAKIGGVSSNVWKLDSMRSNMGYMQQKTTLIRGSIYENIALKDESELSEEQRAEIGKILAAVGLEALIESKESNLSRLSQGELQRVGFARCLYRKAAIWLLDEPTSALDRENEQSIIQLMHEFKQQGITQVVVTHRAGLSEIFDRKIEIKRNENACVR